jgi:hypothetical protein
MTLDLGPGLPQTDSAKPYEQQLQWGERGDSNPRHPGPQQCCPAAEAAKASVVQGFLAGRLAFSHPLRATSDPLACPILAPLTKSRSLPFGVAAACPRVSPLGRGRIVYRPCGTPPSRYRLSGLASAASDAPTAHTRPQGRGSPYPACRSTRDRFRVAELAAQRRGEAPGRANVRGVQAG